MAPKTELVLDTGKSNCVNDDEKHIMIGQLEVDDRQKPWTPIKKLMAGFCDPFVPHHRNDDDDEKTSIESSPDDNDDLPRIQSRSLGTPSSRYMPDLSPQTQSSVLQFPSPQSKSARQISEMTIESTSSNSLYGYGNDENRPEMHVSKAMTKMRRRRGIEVFIMSFVFVLVTVMTLRKLGYTIADFHIVPSSTSSYFFSETSGGTLFSKGYSKSWIYIHDKSSAKQDIDKSKEKAETEDVDTSLQGGPSLMSKDTEIASEDDLDDTSYVDKKELEKEASVVEDVNNPVEEKEATEDEEHVDEGKVIEDMAVPEEHQGEL